MNIWLAMAGYGYSVVWLCVTGWLNEIKVRFPILLMLLFNHSMLLCRWTLSPYV